MEISKAIFSWHSFQVLAEVLYVFPINCVHSENLLFTLYVVKSPKYIQSKSQAIFVFSNEFSFDCIQTV
jgi:hypothetical protein